MRTLVNLPDDDVAWLDAQATERRRSRASLVREAVAKYRTDEDRSIKRDTSWIDQAFGIWKDRTDIGDAVEWQRRERASWTRSWDDDYEDVKAEFPDLFDEEDDRQRRLHLEQVERQTRADKAPG